MNPKSPTMQDIADRAGVSRMTVSLALRNDLQLPERTRSRIQALAREMRYRPNPLVNALMTSIRERRGVSSGVAVALVVHEDWRISPAIKPFLDGAKDRAQQLGCRADIFWIGDEPNQSQQLNRILKSRGISGVVLAPMNKPGGTLNLDWDEFASAALGYSLAEPSLHRAVNHQLHSIRLAFRRLHERGYQRIGFAMMKSNDERVDHNWLGGFLIHQHLFPSSPPPIPMFLTDQFTEETFGKWYLEHRPDAIVGGPSCVRDWLLNLSLKIPEEVAFANLNTDTNDRSLAGIDQNSPLVGAAAVDLVINQLQRNERGVPENPKVVLIEGAWVDGPTVAQRK